MTQTYQPEEKARLRRQLTEQAIQLALESRWEEAAAVNRELLSTSPRDLSTLNRLGKALSELGRYEEARQAYAQALEIEPTNNIARKNLDRLSEMVEAPAAAHAAQRIDPRLFIEETGKTGFTEPVEVSRKALKHLNPGDQVFLRQDGNALYVQDAAGDQVGRIEPRLANRLIRFMESGNQYAAGVTEVTNSGFRIIIRETFQHPSMFGRVSFPAQRGGETTRGYIKGSMVRYEHEDEEEFNEDSDYYDSDETSEDEEKEPDFEDIGFSETEE